MTAALLVLNVGSSSVKFGCYRLDTVEALFRGTIEDLDRHPRMRASGPGADRLLASGQPQGCSGHAELVAWLLEAVRTHAPGIRVRVAGHRVVHGGTRFAEPTLIDSQALAALERLVPLAPYHEPYNIAGIRAARGVWPGIPQIACFDTAFHRTQPRVAQLFGLPRELSDAGVLRYGFHGLSYEYICGELPRIAGAKSEGRVVVAHLGNGASMCALLQRRSMATTMGFTALDGLMMGTRCGALDPGVVLYLIEQQGLTARDAAQLLHARSGLLGVSGSSGDMRDLESSTDAHAAEAVELFVYCANRALGGLVAALGGLDALVFTAGIGEHSAIVRRRLCDAARWAGIDVDPDANARHAERISMPRSAVDVYVVPTDEELVIARACRSMVRHLDLDQKAGVQDA